MLHYICNVFSYAYNTNFIKFKFNALCIYDVHVELDEMNYESELIYI